MNFMGRNVSTRIPLFFNNKSQNDENIIRKLTNWKNQQKPYFFKYLFQVEVFFSTFFSFYFQNLDEKRNFNEYRRNIEIFCYKWYESLFNLLNCRYWGHRFRVCWDELKCYIELNSKVRWMGLQIFLERNERKIEVAGWLERICRAKNVSAYV